ncbi:glycosyltransferase [Flavobacterium sp. JAS]|uniref:glycosyltransferase family 2 protein n=1 Tax=Flavobacterium sp. JAS TaxID=2897329 RepID=UPI001E5A2E8A|nr:glycosyltransferase [Flavobacterium sp. JAS]MCD0471086.1 glycosyltransferase [Flavobacterium sp. JAS]
MKNYNFPLVSLCIPTYNGAKFIGEALDAAINQTYNNIEIIISDDDSNDDTLTIINDKLKNSKISYYIYNHKPNGIGANWNNCIRYARGEYIKFLFQDDLMRPDCIEKMIELAITNNNIGLVYCKRTILHDANNLEHKAWINYGGILHKKWFAIDVAAGVLDGKKYLSDLYLMNDNPLNKIGEPTAVLLKKRCVDKIGLFDEHLKQTLDIDYWYRLMKYYKIGFIDEELVSFRLHYDQASSVNKRNQINEGELLNKKFYKTISWYFHPKKRWKFFKRYSSVGNLARYIKRVCS